MTDITCYARALCALLDVHILQTTSNSPNASLRLCSAPNVDYSQSNHIPLLALLALCVLHEFLLRYLVFGNVLCCDVLWAGLPANQLDYKMPLIVISTLQRSSAFELSIVAAWRHRARVSMTFQPRPIRRWVNLVIDCRPRYIVSILFRRTNYIESNYYTCNY